MMRFEWAVAVRFLREGGMQTVLIELINVIVNGIKRSGSEFA